jgi:hypothetical protein
VADLLQEVQRKVAKVIRARDAPEAERVVRLDIGLEAEPGLEQFEEVEQAEVLLLEGCAL